MQCFEWAEKKLEASPGNWFNFMVIRVGWGDRIILDLNEVFDTFKKTKSFGT